MTPVALGMLDWGNRLQAVAETHGNSHGLHIVNETLAAQSGPWCLDDSSASTSSLTLHSPSVL
jgi:hypothetical protein